MLACSYVYQPIENLVVLVVTTRSSNIIEDLETLHLVAKGFGWKSWMSV